MCTYINLVKETDIKIALFMSVKYSFLASLPVVVLYASRRTRYS